VIVASWVQKGQRQTGKLHVLDYQGNPITKWTAPGYGSSGLERRFAGPHLANLDADATWSWYQHAIRVCSL